MSIAIAQMMIDIFTNVSRWFQSIMSATDGMGFWLGCFLVWQVASKLIIPAVGGFNAGSDTAVKSSKIPATASGYLNSGNSKRR